LEDLRLIRLVITQNIDSLHQRAGSREVVEYHGHSRSLRCEECGRVFARETVSLQELPPRCGCSGPLRPEVVFFGEPIPEEGLHWAWTAVSQCDFLLVVGTSASVAPASQLPALAKSNGAFVVDVNPRTTELSTRLADVHLKDSAGRALPVLADAAAAFCGRDR
jgi:NAD-dependent deacetylase